MEEQRHKDLVARLTEFDVRGVPFPEAKAQLLKEGYSEADITHVVYSAPFDGRDNRVKPSPTALQQAHANHPQAAQLMADAYLQEQAANERRKKELRHITTHAPHSPLEVGVVVAVVGMFRGLLSLVRRKKKHADHNDGPITRY